MVKTYLLHNVHGTGYLVKMVRHCTLHNRAVFHTNWCWNLPFYKIRGEENTTTIISNNRNRYYSKHKLMDHYYKYQKLPILRSRCWRVWNDWMCGISAQMLRVQRQHLEVSPWYMKVFIMFRAAHQFNMQVPWLNHEATCG